MGENTSATQLDGTKQDRSCKLPSQLLHISDACRTRPASIEEGVSSSARCYDSQSEGPLIQKFPQGHSRRFSVPCLRPIKPVIPSPTKGTAGGLLGPPSKEEDSASTTCQASRCDGERLQYAGIHVHSDALPSAAVVLNRWEPETGSSEEHFSGQSLPEQHMVKGTSMDDPTPVEHSESDSASKIRPETAKADVSHGAEDASMPSNALTNRMGPSLESPFLSVFSFL
jgi:hypothetical protein